MSFLRPFFATLPVTSVDFAEIGQPRQAEFRKAGSCEWVAGLKFKDYYTETITRNVLNRFTKGV
jgi:hypothetical protein